MLKKMIVLVLSLVLVNEAKAETPAKALLKANGITQPGQVVPPPDVNAAINALKSDDATIQDLQEQWEIAASDLQECFSTANEGFDLVLQFLAPGSNLSPQQLARVIYNNLILVALTEHGASQMGMPIGLDAQGEPVVYVLSGERNAQVTTQKLASMSADISLLLDGAEALAPEGVEPNQVKLSELLNNQQQDAIAENMGDLLAFSKLYKQFATMLKQSLDKINAV